MKVRSGFVSNSSSSSFFIAVKASAPSPASRTQLLLEALGIDPNTPGGKLFKPFVEYLAGGEQYSEEVLLDDTGCETIEEVREAGYYDGQLKALDLINAGWEVYQQDASNESDDPIGVYFYENNLQELDTDTVKVFER